LRSFWVTAAVFTQLVPAAGWLYAQEKGIESRVAAAAVPALLVEFICYAAIGFAAVRERLLKLSPPLLSLVLIATAILPAAIYPAALGMLEALDLVIVGALAATIVLWFRLLPHNAYSDLAFAAVMITVVLIKGRFFRELYPDVPPGVHLDFLGQLMWIRTGAAAMLLVRRAEGIGYGFVPTREDWRLGVRYFLNSLPFVITMGYAVGTLQLGSPAKTIAMVPVYALAAFLGCYFVVALSEEFLLRGVLLQRFIELTRSVPVACLITAVLSGAVHLSFRHAWNWKFALVAGVAHYFYGQAYLAGRGIRPAMIAHSLMVTTWVMAFAKSA